MCILATLAGPQHSPLSLTSICFTRCYLWQMLSHDRHDVLLRCASLRTSAVHSLIDLLTRTRLDGTGRMGLHPAFCWHVHLIGGQGSCASVIS